jgi:hypothetical protein
MASKISRCIICGLFFDSKKELREHKDKNHRITNAKMAAAARIIGLATSSSSFIKVYSELRSKKMIRLNEGKKLMLN